MKQFFRIVGTYFSTNTLFRLVKTYFLSSRNSMLCSEPFFCCWKPWLKLGGINFNRKIFSCWLKPFPIFLPEESVFQSSGNLFFNECFILGSGKRFSGLYKPYVFFRLMETYFLTNPLVQLLEKDFLVIGNRLLYLRVLSYQPKRHWYEWKPFLKDRPYSC